MSSRVGIITGFLASVAMIPFLAGKEDSTPEKPNTPQAQSRTLKEKDFDLIQSVLNMEDPEDLRLQETKWAELVYPTVRERLINLYKAEAEDLKGLKEGRITEKERKVKTCLTDFVRAGEEGDDMGVGPKLHLETSFDDKLPNGKTYRTYINASLTVNEETGAVHPPDGIRIKVQAFGGGIEDLYKPDIHAEFLFISDRFLIAWGKDKPLLGRQHFFGDYNNEKKSSDIVQTEEILSTPNSCYFCHEVSTSNAHTKHIFKDPNVKRINYGAITQDYMFDLPISKQPGYKKYMAYLEEKNEKGELTKEEVEKISQGFVSSTSFSTIAPSMLKGFEENKDIPWLDGDTKATDKEKKLYRFTYEDVSDIWTRRIYSHYGLQLIDLKELQLIPKK